MGFFANAQKFLVKKSCHLDQGCLSKSGTKYEMIPVVWYHIPVPLHQKTDFILLKLVAFFSVSKNKRYFVIALGKKLKLSADESLVLKANATIFFPLSKILN
jgi:hypothetical protein